jgi:integrase
MSSSREIVLTDVRLLGVLLPRRVATRAGLAPALAAGAIPDFRFHDCRHTFASRLAMTLGVDFYTVQRAGGWKGQAMGQRNAHLRPDLRPGRRRAHGPSQSEGGTGTKTGTGATV